MLWLATAIAVTEPCFAEDRVTAVYTFPDTPGKDFQNKFLPDSIANDRKVLLGSIGSDLWHGRQDPGDEFWMITDRGPNGQIRVDGSNRRTFWVPEFNPTILKVKIVDKEIRILEALPLLGKSGRPVTGLPNFKGVDETPYNYSAQEVLRFDSNGLDTEGLVRTSKGEFWIAEEYSPSLLHVDRSGKVLKRYAPEGLQLERADYPVSRVLPAIYSKRKINRGFEGLALSHDETTLYLVLQSPLLNPDRKTGDQSRNTRVLVFDIVSEKITAEYVYQFDVSTQFAPNPKNTPDEMKLSGVVSLDPTTLLVLERTDLVAKLYSVDMTKATNILHTPWDNAKTAPSLESLDDPASAQIRVLAEIAGARSKLAGGDAGKGRRHRGALTEHNCGGKRQRL